MRAIIIEEDRFVEVLELMRAKAKSIANDSMLRHDLRKSGLSEVDIEIMADSISRSLTIDFVRWAQSHGARCLR